MLAQSPDTKTMIQFGTPANTEGAKSWLLLPIEASSCATLLQSRGAYLTRKDAKKNYYHFCVFRGGGAVLEEPQIKAPPKRLQLLWRSPRKEPCQTPCMRDEPI